MSLSALQRENRPRVSWQAEAQRRLAVKQLEKRRALQPALSLADFVERTTGHVLDDWQRHMCARLERLEYERDQRLIIHAPPQMGKSVILSQRFPVWMLTRRPDITIKLACYNITRAAKHSRVARDLMQSREFLQMFPSADLRLPKIASSEEWSTAARLAKRDSQSSFKALGLQTGFVGEGADLLLVDDPYASPEDARSAIINEKTCAFWPETAKPRMKPGANVVKMFHRYTEDDAAGRALAEGGWEYLRYAAIADGNYKQPQTGQTWDDPLGREDGELLSRRFPEEWYAERQANGYTWLSQFQGRPTAKEGAFFKVSNLQIIPAAPVNLKTVRAWDLAASTKGDYTAGVKLGKDDAGLFYVLDVARGQWLPDERNRVMSQTAALDGRQTRIRLAQDPGQAGVDQVQSLTRMLAGYNVKAERVSGSKETRADAFAAQVNAGNVRLIEGKWNRELIEELRTFPLGKNDDQVDAASDSFNDLCNVGTFEQSEWIR